MQQRQISYQMSFHQPVAKALARVVRLSGVFVIWKEAKM